MSGLFENLFMDDSQQRTAGRQAAAVAVKRAKDRFSIFLARSSSIAEREARLDLINDDLMQVVADVAHEYDADAMRLDKIVRDALTGRDRVAKVVEARRPKMCPYHREVMDISLAAGEPIAGFNAMAQHAWGKNHCQGEFDGGCNFRREMVTQEYWDKKADEAAERAQQRQQIDIQDGVGSPIPDTVEQPDIPDVAEPEDPGAPESDDPSIIDDPGEVPEQIGDFSMAASTRMGEALKTEDVTKGGETGSPKIDKRKWTPDNVAPLDTEADGSPHPTQQQDITDKPKYDSDGFKDDKRLEHTDAVAEHDVDVTQGSETKAVPGPTSGPYTWSGDGGQADPVTSDSVGTVSAALDVDKNPLREILEKDFGGFVPTNVVQQAVASYQRKEAYGDYGDESGDYGDPYGEMSHGRPEQGEYMGGPAHGCSNCGESLGDTDMTCPTCGAPQWEGDPNHGVPQGGPYADGSITPGSGRHWSDPNPGPL